MLVRNKPFIYKSIFTINFPDIGDFLKEEIKGPASFSCKTGDGCKFEEPAMNQLINDVFGDPYITIDCFGGECLHYSQVPGYVVSMRFYRVFYLMYITHRFPPNQGTIVLSGSPSVAPVRVLSQSWHLSVRHTSYSRTPFLFLTLDTCSNLVLGPSCQWWGLWANPPPG